MSLLFKECTPLYNVLHVVLKRVRVSLIPRPSLQRPACMKKQTRKVYFFMRTHGEGLGTRLGASSSEGNISYLGL